MSLAKPSLDLSIFLCKSIFFPKCHYKIFYWQIIQWYYHSYPACDSLQYQILLPLYEFQWAFQLSHLLGNHHQYLMVFPESQYCSFNHTDLFYLDQIPAQIFYFLIFRLFAEASGFQLSESFTSSKLSATITATFLLISVMILSNCSFTRLNFSSILDLMILLMR